MDLVFTSSDLHDACSRQRAMRRRWGTADAAIIAQRLQELDAADVLGDVALLPFVRVVPTSNGKVVTVQDEHGVRIRMRPQADSRRRSDSYSWREATEVVVLDVAVGSQ